jgi:hypothetical protein
MLKTVMLLRLMFRVKNRDKAMKEFGRAEEILGRKLELAGLERYWKIPELWDCRSRLTVETQTEAEQIEHYLLLANRLANGWYVLGPHYSWPDQRLDGFEGTFKKGQSHSRLSSLDWAHFDMTRPDASGDAST